MCDDDPTRVTLRSPHEIIFGSSRAVSLQNLTCFSVSSTQQVSAAKRRELYAARARSLLAFIAIGPIFYEANEPSSACYLRHIYPVETSTPPLVGELKLHSVRRYVKQRLELILKVLSLVGMRCCACGHPNMQWPILSVMKCDTFAAR